MAISGLGYYPNPLAPDAAEAEVYVEHIKKVIAAAALLGRQPGEHLHRPRLDASRSTTTGRGSWKSGSRWCKFAEDHGVRIGIENCPMLFTSDEWPGGKNLATSPAIWRRMFERHSQPELRPELRPVAPGLAADGLPQAAARVRRPHLPRPRQGRPRSTATGSTTSASWPRRCEYHTPKLPGLGDVDWGRFFSALTDVGYRGPVCVEVEDRAYEGLAGARARPRCGRARDTCSSSWREGLQDQSWTTRTSTSPR